MQHLVGQHVHKLIAELALAPSIPRPSDILSAASQMWEANPVGGSLASSCRIRAGSAAAVYFARFRPAAEWSLDSSETRVGSAIADLVWIDDEGQRVIDEVKTHAPRPDEVDDQLERLAAGGAERWGDSFLGVRLVPLAAPGRSRFVQLFAGRTVDVEAVDGFEVR